MSLLLDQDSPLRTSSPGQPPALRTPTGLQFPTAWLQFPTASALLLPAFLFGDTFYGLTLIPAVALIAVFMLLDRVYSMALVISIPQMFPSTGDKTAFGSLNTLTAWGAMMAISWFQGQFLGRLGMTVVEAVLVGCFLVGSAMLYLVQARTVFQVREEG